jgi:hypothetical protein
MAKVPLKLPMKEAAEGEPASQLETETAAPPPIPEANRQSRKPESGRYWLQVDRQTKSSYETEEAAATAGLLIKKQYSMVQVAIYDRKEGSNRIVELPV